jgi:uroporphyrinogen decarboxylase
MMWDEGYTFDELIWFDDMAYRNGMFFSKKMWRAIIKPYQQRVIDWAHAHSIKANLHCCGNINALIPDLIDMGLDALNPLEVKAGMDPVHIKEAYGKDLLLRGGSNAMYWDNSRKVEQDIRRMLPAMMDSGGYIFASDHSVPDYTSLETYWAIVQTVKEIGRY